MDISIVCPACQETIQQGSLVTMPSVCPSCGVRITCPDCGSRLERRSDTLVCSRCGPATGHGSTVLQTTAVGAPPLPAVPGFEVQGELGRGGMGIVYRARQSSLDREVALKVLPPALAGTEHLLKRFRNEARVAANLVNAHVLPVFDVLEVHGAPVLVLPLIHGCDLGRIVRDRARLRAGDKAERPHAWALLDDRAYLGQVLPVLDLLLTAVTALHREGVLHRDIKPSNVLIDEWGKPWLSDFGLARLEEEGVGTVTGQGMGTAGYMAPEQWVGVKDVDYRSDLFSLGATLYQVLTLELPYGKEYVADHGPPPVPPSARQPLLPRDYDTVILKALERNRDDRYGSAAELEGDWQRVRQGQLPRARRLGRTQRLARAARRHPVPTAFGLVAAALIAMLAGAAAMRDDTVTRAARIVTLPAGARVVLVPLDPNSGEPVADRALRPSEPSPVTVKRVPVGQYLVVAEVPKHGFHEVYRTVPAPGQRVPFPESTVAHHRWAENAEGVVELPAIIIPAADVTRDMAQFAGGEFTMGSPQFTFTQPHQRKVAAFYLDTTEVTNAAYRRVFNDLPPRQRERKGDDFPATCVNFHIALEFAERVGKRLPDEAEYEFAATGAGRRAFPWGDDARKLGDWPFDPVRQPSFDVTPTEPPVYGLFSNAAEWTATVYGLYPGTAEKYVQNYRSLSPARSVFDLPHVVRGGGWSVAKGAPSIQDGARQNTPRYRMGVTPSNDDLPGLGFRCARSAKPRY